MAKVIPTSQQELVELLSGFQKGSFHTITYRKELIPSAKKYGDHVITREYDMQVQIGGDYYHTQGAKERLGEDPERKARVGVIGEEVKDLILIMADGEKALNAINPRVISPVRYWLDGEEVSEDFLLQTFAPSAIGKKSHTGEMPETLTIRLKNIYAIN